MRIHDKSPIIIQNTDNSAKDTTVQDTPTKETKVQDTAEPILKQSPYNPEKSKVTNVTVLNDKESILTFSNGNVYIGETKDGKMNGKGCLLLLNIGYYVGRFNDDHMDGYGNIIYADGSNYKGQLKDGVKNGQGTFIDADRSEYEGQFINGQKHGMGTLKHIKGYSYNGQFERDVMHGIGVYTFLNEFSWTGELENNILKESKGVLSYEDKTCLYGTASKSGTLKKIDDDTYEFNEITKKVQKQKVKTSYIDANNKK